MGNNDEFFIRLLPQIAPLSSPTGVYMCSLPGSRCHQALNWVTEGGERPTRPSGHVLPCPHSPEAPAWSGRARTPGGPCPPGILAGSLLPRATAGEGVLCPACEGAEGSALGAPAASPPPPAPPSPLTAARRQSPQGPQPPQGSRGATRPCCFPCKQGGFIQTHRAQTRAPDTHGGRGGVEGRA